MMFLLISLLTMVLVFVIAWLVVFFRLNDLSLPEASLAQYRKVMLIFPHPDDEVLTAGGLIGRLRAQGSQVVLVIFTLGERGTPDGNLDVSLKETRELEAEKVAKTLDISELIQKDFGDGELMSKTSELEIYLDDLIRSQKPDLVITYDQSGLYGHPDHIAVSQVVTHLLSTRFSDSELWFPSYPQAVLDMIGLPEHMAQDETFKSRRLLPTHRVGAPWSFWKKAQAIKQYASQTQSFKKGLPVKWLPFEVMYSLTPYEYFAVSDKKQYILVR